MLRAYKVGYLARGVVVEFKQILVDVDVNRAIEASRQLLSESENDILRRMLLD